MPGEKKLRRSSKMRMLRQCSDWGMTDPDKKKYKIRSKFFDDGFFLFCHTDKVPDSNRGGACRDSSTWAQASVSWQIHIIA